MIHTDRKEQTECGDVNMILRYRKSISCATLCPQYLTVFCLPWLTTAVRNHSGGKNVQNTVENWDRVLKWRRISAAEHRFDQRVFFGIS